MGAEWLEGLVLHESGGDPRAYHIDKLDPLMPTDFQLDASYGLMQVEGRTALGQMLGSIEAWKARPWSFDYLYYPLMGMACGLRALMTSLAVSEGLVEPALAFYNGGVWGMSLNPADPHRLNDQGYVELVYEATQKVHDDR
jgi:hypothetical protein